MDRAASRRAARVGAGDGLQHAMGHPRRPDRGRHRPADHGPAVGHAEGAPARRRLPRLRASGPLGELLARQAQAHGHDFGVAELGQACVGLSDDLRNFHYDPVAAREADATASRKPGEVRAPCMINVSSLTAVQTAALDVL
jgi:hypothetical protein